MIEMTEKALSKALKDSDYFQTLAPGEMMHVLITDVISRGDVKKKDFEHWMTQEEHWPQISAPDRMDEVLRVLEEPAPSAALQALQRTGFMAFCLPKCFPIRKLMDKKTFYNIIDNFDALNIRRDDVGFRLAMLMFSFDPYATEVTLRDANFTEEAVDWICNLIYFYMEFIRLRNQKSLEEFVGRFGKDFYFDMNDYAQYAWKLGKMRELKPLESYSFVDSMIKHGYVLDAEDLEVTAQDLWDAGAESEEEVEALQSILVKHCHKYKDENKKKMLLALVHDLTQKQIDKEIKHLKKVKTRRY